MSEMRYTIIRSLYLLAAVIFVGQSLFGCFAVLGVGFDTGQMSFSIFR
jgi:hypothetical protein